MPAEFLDERPLRQIGFIGGLEDFTTEPLGRTFDALVRIGIGTAAHALPWSDRETSEMQVLEQNAWA
jgi:hypothetical protein